MQQREPGYRVLQVKSDLDDLIKGDCAELVVDTLRPCKSLFIGREFLINGQVKYMFAPLDNIRKSKETKVISYWKEEASSINFVGGIARMDILSCSYGFILPDSSEFDVVANLAKQYLD